MYTWLSVCAWVCTCHQNLCGQVPKVGNPDRTVGVLLFSTKQKAANRVVTFVMAEKNSRPHVRQWIDSIMSQCWIRNVSDPLTSAYFCEKWYFLKWCASFTPTAFSHKTSTANQQPAQIAVDSEADPPSSRQIRPTVSLISAVRTRYGPPTDSAPSNSGLTADPRRIRTLKAPFF